MQFDPVSYINEPRWQQVSLGLSRIRMLLDLLGNPEKSLKFVHVAGTNGKGSTCAYIASICRAAGLHTGLFTSPYLERFEERIRVNGKDISSEELLACTLLVKGAALIVEERTGEHPTEFELMCAVALLHFMREKCDICVMEVGLGGRLDATNVITPELSVITPISLDHTRLLGNTIAEVAFEKAGIIKQGVPCACGIQEPSALAIIKRRCERTASPLSVLTASMIEDIALSADLARTFTFEGKPFQTTLIGTFQPENACLAIMSAHILAADGWHITDEDIHQGIAHATWPGRFEVMGKRPFVIVDGAHNPAGSESLRTSLEELATALGRSVRPLFVLGALKDKDVKGIIAPQVSHAKAFFLYPPDNTRALSADELENIIHDMDADARTSAYPRAGVALSAALEKATPEDVVVAFGSLYSIGMLKRAYRSWSKDHSTSGVSRP